MLKISIYLAIPGTPALSGKELTNHRIELTTIINTFHLRLQRNVVEGPPVLESRLPGFESWLDDHLVRDPGKAT